MGWVEASGSCANSPELGSCLYLPSSSSHPTHLRFHQTWLKPQPTFNVSSGSECFTQNFHTHHFSCSASPIRHGKCYHYSHCTRKGQEIQNNRFLKEVFWLKPKWVGDGRVYVFVLLLLLSWDRNSLGSPGWPWTRHRAELARKPQSPPSASLMLESGVWLNHRLVIYTSIIQILPGSGGEKILHDRSKQRGSRAFKGRS